MTDSKPQTTDELQATMLAIVALLAEEREASIERTAARKTELLLSDAGLSRDAIAKVLGKNPDTVRKTLERARKAAGA